MCLGTPLGSIPFRCVYVVGCICHILDLLVCALIEKEGFVPPLWCAHAGIGCNCTRGTSVETASGNRKDGIIGCVRSQARVIRCAIPLVVRAQIPCVFRTVAVRLKPLTLCSCFFRVGVVPCRHVEKLRAYSLKRVADGPEENGFIPTLSHGCFVDGKGCLAGVETIHRFPLPCFFTGHKKVWPRCGSSGVVLTCMREPPKPLCHAILFLCTKNRVIVPLPARLYNG